MGRKGAAARRAEVRTGREGGRGRARKRELSRWKKRAVITRVPSRRVSLHFGRVSLSLEAATAQRW